MAYSRMSAAEKAAEFEKARQDRTAQREEETARRGMVGVGDDGVPKTALGVLKQGGGPSLVRFLGRPASRRKEGTDVKEIQISDIRYIEKVYDLKDLPSDLSRAKRKAMRCIWPDRDAGERPHILWRLRDKVLQYTWDPKLGEKGGRVYEYAQGGTLDLFNEVSKNGMPNAKVVKGWTPKKRMLMNVIDRRDMVWHQVNKSTRLLCSACHEWTPPGKEPIPIWDIGIPYTLYDGDIWDRIVENYGYWDDYDILIWKLTDSPWYGAKHYSVEPRVTEKDGLKLTDEMMKRAGSPITDEEASWDLINFDERFPVTSYRQIRAKLGYVFQMFDKAFDQHFYEELRELAEAEKEESDVEDDLPADAMDEKGETHGTGWTPQSAQTSTPVSVATSAPQTANQAAAAPSRATRGTVSSPSIDWAGLADGSFNGTKYLGIPLLNDEEKALILGVNADGSFKYKDGIPVLKNTKNDFYSPADFRLCPLSGEFFEN